MGNWVTLTQSSTGKPIHVNMDNAIAVRETGLGKAYIIFTAGADPQTIVVAETPQEVVDRTREQEL